MQEQIISRFRKVAIVEGISYLLLLGLTAPLKHLAGIGWPNMVMGSIHGFLFVVYLIRALPLYTKLNWSIFRMAVVVLASFIPFATFWLEKKVLVWQNA